MQRAVIYARYSTDLQHERSIDDQIALCRTYCARERLAVVATYQDRAKSGSSILGRDGLIQLLAHSREGGFDVLVVEHSDRLSRSMRDLSEIYERFVFAGIELRAVHSGTMDTAMVGLFGLVGQMQREDGAKKVRRGLAGVVASGRYAGGRAYGYAPITGRPGELAIVEAEAEIVRRIYREYAGGKSPRAIAAGLNADLIPAPRGRNRTSIAINGNSKRGNGILQNPIYAGRIVWNRVRMVKDPDTGRRISRPNAESEHHTAAAPHLAIIDADLFGAAQSVRQDRAIGPVAQVRKPKHPLSGLLRCGACGGGMSVKDKDHGRVRIHCTLAKEASSCDNRRPYYLDAVERTVVGGLRQRLQHPRLIEAYVRAYNDERRRLASDLIRNRSRIERRLDATRGEIQRALDLLIKGLMSEDEGRTRLGELRPRQAEIEEQLRQCEQPPKVVALHPRAIEDYLATVSQLEAAIRAGMPAAESAQALRDMIESVTVTPPVDGEIQVHVRGKLSALIGDDQAFPSGTLRGGSMVAREGLEPPTRGL